jgi:hypothetical protein
MKIAEKSVVILYRHRIWVKNAAVRKVDIELASDPDIVIRWKIW